MNRYNIELFADQLLQCGEGPLWDSKQKRLFWTESGGTEIFCANENDSHINIFSRGVHAASLTLHQKGGLMLCGRDGFYHLSNEGTLRMVCDVCGGLAVKNINDIIADPLGRVFGGQDVFRENEEYKTGYLFRVDISGQTKIVEDGLHLSNGMGFSPAVDKFYLVDSIPRNIYEYDYDILTGEISNKRILVTLDRDDGLPDGMTVDAEGFIWVARWFGNGLSRFDPDGMLERKIKIPAAQTSSLTFGGKDFNEIFVTSAAVQWETSLAPQHHNFAIPRGGAVYRIVQDIQGRPEYQARV